MVAVTARQVIYSRIESPFSPDRKSGFKVFYATPGLAQGDIDLIEKQVQCFEAPSLDSTRYQFFQLSSGSFAVTQSRPISKEVPRFKEVIDSDARSGAFIAHALVLTENQLAQLQNNPFMVIENAPFIGTVEALLAQWENPQEGVAIYAERLKISHLAASAWSSQDIASFYELSRIRKQPQTLALRGTEPEVRQVLRQILLFASPSERAGLTFDTLADRCPPPRQVYWAVGTNQAFSNAGFTEVDIRNPSANDLVSDSQVSDLYSRWMRERLKSGGTVDAAMMRDVEQVQRVAAAVEQGKPVPDTTDAALLRSIMRSNYSWLLEGVTAAFSRFLPTGTAHSLAKGLVDDKLSTAKTPITTSQLLHIAGQQRVQVDKTLAQSFYRWMIDAQYHPQGGERALYQVGKTTAVLELQVLALLAERPAQLDALLNALKQLVGFPDSQMQALATAVSALHQQARLQKVLDETLPVVGQPARSLLKSLVASNLLSSEVQNTLSTYQRNV